MTDLLSAVYGIQIRNEEKISEADRDYCQRRQDLLYKSLDQLDYWYGIFKAESDKYIERKGISYNDDGSIKDSYRLHTKYIKPGADYTPFEFWPFKDIDRIVDLRIKAVCAFSRDIINYFNEKYNVEIPRPEVDTEKMPVGFRPVYMSHVDLVIEHLGGKSFRETAEEELIDKFLDVVKPRGWDKTKPELKGDKIVFPRAVKFKNYDWDADNKISYGNLDDFNAFCAGIIFFVTTALNGHAGCIREFDHENVDFTRSYDMTPNGKVTIKLYKNGRADIKFSEKMFAEQCFSKLRLGSLELRNND